MIFGNLTSLDTVGICILVGCGVGGVSARAWKIEWRHEDLWKELRHQSGVSAEVPVPMVMETKRGKLLKDFPKLG